MSEHGPPVPILTILAVDDVAAAARFYRAAFGWEPRVEVEVYVELALPDGRGVGLYQREAMARTVGAGTPAPCAAGGITGAELYLGSEFFERDLARLREAGARELSPPRLRDWGDEVAYFADPAGNVLALARRLP